MFGSLDLPSQLFIAERKIDKFMNLWLFFFSEKSAHHFFADLLHMILRYQHNN